MGRHKKEKWTFIDMPSVKKNYYKISTWGNIETINGKRMSYDTDKDGYKKCTLTLENGKKKHFFVHRLVAIHFIPNPENKEQVNHLRPWEKSNLYVEYLEWSTPKENRKHAQKHHLQTILTCSAHGMSTMSNDDVEKVCQMMQDGYSNNDICKAFGYTNKNKKEKEKFRSKIKHIRARKTWIPISRKYKF
jgi:hypothetical protein